jgi:chromosome segregation ATPase
VNNGPVLDELRALREEGAARGERTQGRLDELTKTIATVSSQQVEQSRRLVILEARAHELERRLRDVRTDSTRALSETDLRHESEMAAAIVHVQNLEQALRELRDNDEKQNVALAKIGTTATSIEHATTTQATEIGKVQGQRWAVYATLAAALWEVAHGFFLR